MRSQSSLLVVVGAVAAINGAMASNWNNAIEFVAQQANLTLKQVGSDRTQYPNEGTKPEGSQWELDQAGSWTTSFFPGTLWRLGNASQYSIGGLSPSVANFYKEAAASFLPGLTKEENNTGTHDVGFMMLESFVEGYLITGNTSWRDVAIQGAHSLATRFDPKLGVFRSWNGPSYPHFRVIIDSAMNAPLLAFAGRETKNQTLVDMAKSHYTHLMQDGLIRQGGDLDGCTFHLIDYNESSGGIIDISSVPQGYNATSLWSRGQAWAVAGFLTAYELYGEPEFLNYTRRAAQCFVRHVRSCCSDSIPLFDFIVPKNLTSRDTSAAAITAQALLRLAPLVPASEATVYRDLSRDMLLSLAKPPYKADPSTSDAVLLHGYTGYGSPNADVSLVYGDMYYLKALLLAEATNL